MVTEDRSAIWGIGLASYLTQTYADTFLSALAAPIGDYVDGALVRLTDAAPAGNLASALVSARATVSVSATAPKPVRVGARSERGGAAVPALLDSAVRRLFEVAKCDVVALFDDDDWSPPDRLAQVARVADDYMQAYDNLDKIPFACSYDRGWMVNLRTFEGRELKLLHLWGSTFAFNKQAWLLADGFSPGPWPGQDRAFLERVARRGGVLHALGGVFAPINFCHNKNVASFAVGDGLTPLGVDEPPLSGMPPMVLREVLRGQAFMIDRGIYPPGTGDSA
jgi:hypothetical protein